MLINIIRVIISKNRKKEMLYLNLNSNIRKNIYLSNF